MTGLVKNLADEGIKSSWPRVYKPITFQISSIINVFLLSRLNVLRFGNEDAFLLKKKKKKAKEIYNSMWYPIQTENISDKANSDGLVLITEKELQYRTNFREGKMLKKKKVISV